MPVQFPNIFNVEITKGPAIEKLFPLFYANNEANRIGARLFENGRPFIHSGTVEGTAILSDGYTVRLTGNTDGNLVYVDLTEECYTKPGAIRVFLTCVNGQAPISTVLLGLGTVNLTETGKERSFKNIYDSVSALTHISLTESGYIKDGGQEAESADYHRTGFIPVNSDSVLILEGFYVGSASGSAYAYYFFDSSKAAIAGEKEITGRTVVTTIPGNAAYVRFSSRTMEGENPVAYVSNHVVEDVADLKPRMTNAEGNISALQSAVAGKQNTLTFDDMPTANSENPVKSGGVYTRLNEKVAKPATDGTNGQLLRTNGNGTTQWVDQGTPTDEQVGVAVDAWLDEHPEATTTVEDGAISRAKLDADLQGTVDDVACLKSAVGDYITDAPTGYTRVESLASTVGGNQYCSMGRKLDQDSRITLTFALTQLELTGYICGARYASGNNGMTIGINSANHLRIGYGDAYVTTDVIINDTNPHTVDVNKNNVYFDGALVETFTYETFQTEGNGYLFGITAHTSNLYRAVKILRCLVYDNGTLVSDYIPVIDVSTGLGGMYDLVQHLFRRNPSETPLVTGSVQSIPNNAERIGALEGAMGNAQTAISANASGIDGTNALINAIHGFVNYGYDTPANLAANPASTGATKIGVIRNGINVVLNGTNDIETGTNTIKIKINGTVSRVTASADVKAWEGISLETGKRYTVVSRFLGGSMVEGGVALACKGLSIYRAGENDTIGTLETHDNIAERSFVAEEGVTYNFALFIPNGAVYDNAQLMITLETATGGGGGGVREYIEPEANRVAEKVRNVQTGKTLTFVACSDLHYLDGNTTVENALVDMRDGIKAIAGQVHLDFYACFGDIIYRLSTDDSANDFEKGKAEAIAATKLLNDAFSFAPQIRMVGNHDTNGQGPTGYFTPDQLNAFIGIYSNMLEKVEEMPNQGIGYHDFERQKIRVIALNTSYYESAPTQDATHYRVGPAQTYQMCRMLDISDKADADEWQLMIFSHVHLAAATHALDIGRYTAALNAYVNGDEWSTIEGTGYSYNFSGKNSAQLALYINGHAHYYRALNMRHVRYNGDILNTLPMAALCVPNALPDRDGTSMDGVTYTKTAKTAESTAFQVITIDPESKTVYAHHWGAGIDMILHYDPTDETNFSTSLTNPTWASDDAAIATVSGGAVTPVAEGYVVIWAKSEADNCIECWNFHSVV